jgi:hypothetical protein
MRKNKNGRVGLTFLSTGLSFAGLIFLGTTGVRASLINYEFQGQVLIGGMGARISGQEVVFAGQHVTGSLSFDPDSYTPDPGAAAHPNTFGNQFFPAWAGRPRLEFSIGQYDGVATGSPSSVFNKDGFMFADMAFDSFHGPLGNNVAGNIDFYGFGQGIFSADPTTSLAGGHWDRVTRGQFGGNSMGGDIVGNLRVNVTGMRLEGSPTCP